jgi:hypothetical protein
VRAENPVALRFILQDDVYLLQGDKASIIQIPVTPVADVPQSAADVLPDPIAVEPVLTEPVVQPVVVEIPVLTEPVTATPQITVTETLAEQFNYLGGNKKQFLIITHYLNEEHIAADHLTALQNILKRKDYEIDDVAILNIAKATVTTVTDIVSYFKPEKLLILGEAAVPAGMGVPPVNQYKKMKNGVFLRSFSFDEMMSSTDNKKVFWEQMKNL